MDLGKAKGVLLIVCVMVSLFVSSWFVPVSISPGGERPIQLYVVDAADSRSWYVGSTSAVRDGINAARVDARDRTKVKLAGETIPEPIIVSSTADLEYLVNHPPERAVFINTHGEAVPMPGSYLSPMLKIVSPPNGQVIDANVTGYSVTVSAIVKTFGGGALAGLPSVKWIEPSGAYGLPPEEKGPVPLSLVDPVSGLYQRTINLCFTFLYEFHVSAKTVHGLSATACVTVDFRGCPLPNPFCLGPPRPSVPICPYVHPWNGSCFAADNNVLVQNDSAVDYYALERNLVKSADGNYALRLEESGGKLDFFDYVRLLAVDHPSDTGVYVDVNGSVYGCSGLRAPKSARFNNHYSILCYVSAQEGVEYPFESCDRLDLEFDGLNDSSVARLVLRTRSEEGCVVSVKRPDDLYGWVTLTQVPSRALWGTILVNLTGWLPELASGRLLLSFNKHCEVDYVGLDVSPEVNVTVSEGELAYADDSTGVNATFGSLLREDEVYARLKHGYTIDLGFRLPVLNGSNLERDFIFVSKGYYKEDGGGALGGLSEEGSGEIVVDWMDWFDLIEDRCRTKGWVWANVAGYSFHYFGTKDYWDMQPPGYQPWFDTQHQPCQWGLKQFMNKDVRCNTTITGTRLAKLGFDYSERSGFWGTYLGLDCHRNVSASRPFLKNTGLLWNMLFYKDKEVDAWSSATIAMNKTAIGYSYVPGVFIHNGFSEDVDLDGTPNTYADDRFKGYVATALAIEEARAFITSPSLHQVVWTSGFPKHTACFGAAIRAADRGEMYDPVEDDYYRYIRLLLITGADFKRTGGYYLEMYGAYYLSVADISLCRANDVSYEIFETKCGCELGPEPSIMNDMFWYVVSSASGHVPGVGVFFGPVLDVLPTLVADFHPAWKILSGWEAYANGTRINPNEKELDRGKGTIGFFVEVRFYKRTGGTRTYTFTSRMSSWIGWIGLCDVPYIRILSNTMQLSFEADWTI